LVVAHVIDLLPRKAKLGNVKAQRLRLPPR
jgi:hypothetical protein